MKLLMLIVGWQKIIMVKKNDTMVDAKFGLKCAASTAARVQLSTLNYPCLFIRRTSHFGDIRLWRS